jgi:hypothetical protein
MQHDTGERIFRESVNRAPLDAIRTQAMIATHGKIGSLGIWVYPTFEFAYATPLNVSWIPILFVAGDLARTTADALGHIEVKAVLLAWFEWSSRNERLDECGRGSSFKQCHTHKVSIVTFHRSILKGQRQTLTLLSISWC